MCLNGQFLLHPCGLGKDLGLRELTWSGFSPGTILQVEAHVSLEHTSTNLKSSMNENAYLGREGIEWLEVGSTLTS